MHTLLDTVTVHRDITKYKSLSRKRKRAAALAKLNTGMRQTQKSGPHGKRKINTDKDEADGKQQRKSRGAPIATEHVPRDLPMVNLHDLEAFMLASYHIGYGLDF